jgi:hypothetical protein
MLNAHLGVMEQRKVRDLQAAIEEIRGTNDRLKRENERLRLDRNGPGKVKSNLASFDSYMRKGRRR